MTESKFVDELSRELAGRLLAIWEGRSGLAPAVEDQYRNLWRAQAGLAPKVEPCRFHGKATGETIPCTPCGGRVRLKLYECSHPKHAGTCTLEAADPATPNCKDCQWRNREPADADAVVAFALRLRTEPIFDIWQYDHDLVRDAHIANLREAVRNPSAVNLGEGRGIVMGVGGTLYFACAFAAVSVLRSTGCTLPVEWWHLGPAELDPKMIAEAGGLGVSCVDALAVADRVGRPRILNGWELKPFAVAWSAFREVLYLDADNIAVRDPSALFDDPEYRRHGAAFWPDLPPPDREEWLPTTAWRNVGLEYRHEPDFESGQLIVDKGRCARELAATIHINSHSDWYYKFVYGDKSTFHLAWRVCGSDYAMPDRPAEWDWPAIQQYDFRGVSTFQHVCQGKAELAAGEPLASLHCGSVAASAIRDLRSRWQGGIWAAVDQTPEETDAMRRLVGEWRYVRLGIGAREVVRSLDFQMDGAIGLGAAACERAWTVRTIDGKPTIVITGEAHKGTRIGMMFLAESPDGVWRGEWQAHERGPVELIPPKRSEILPIWWDHRDGTWDRAMFDSVVVHDEYRLSGRDLSGGGVLDLGAHTGTFAYAARRRGASAVHCYEAWTANAAVLERNAVFLGCTVFREAVGAPGRARFVPCAVPANTGGGGIVPDPDGDVAVVGLDTAIERLALASPNGRVRLLKFDIEGGEWAALANATRLDLVDEVLGEYHGDPAHLPRLLDGFAIQTHATAAQLGLFWGLRGRRMDDRANHENSGVVQGRAA